MSGHPKFFKLSSFFSCLFEGLVNHFIMDGAMRSDACILCRAWAGKASWVISLLALSQSIFCLQPYKVFRRTFETPSGLQQIQSQQLNKISSWRKKQHCSMMIVFCVTLSLIISSKKCQRNMIIHIKLLWVTGGATMQALSLTLSFPSWKANEKLENNRSNMGAFDQDLVYHFTI